MAPGVCDTVAVTPSDPFAPCPEGHVGVLLLPRVHVVGDVLDMYRVNAAVVPELSDRWTVAIPMLGSVTPELRAAIAGSFHLVILPAKIPAIASAFSLSVLTP